MALLSLAWLTLASWGFVALREGCVALPGASSRFKGCVALPVLCRAGGCVALLLLHLRTQLQVCWPLPFLDIAQLLQMLAGWRYVLRLFARVYASYATAQPRSQAHRVPEYACPFVPATTSSFSQGSRGRRACTSAYDTALFSRIEDTLCAPAVLPASAMALSTQPWLRLRR